MFSCTSCPSLSRGGVISLSSEDLNRNFLLDNKANIDASNFNANAINSITGWSFPSNDPIVIDHSSLVKPNHETIHIYTAPTWGIFRVQVTSNFQGFFDISLNVVDTGVLGVASNSEKGVTTSTQIDVRPGDEIRMYANNNNFNWGLVLFTPTIGAIESDYKNLEVPSH